MRRKTDSSNPADWLYIAGIDLSVIQVAARESTGFLTLRRVLAEALEKVLKAELIRLGWTLVKTHDLELLLQFLSERNSDFSARAASLCDDLDEVYFTDRYPGFDLDDEDWPGFHAQLEQVIALHCEVGARLPAAKP